MPFYPGPGQAKLINDNTQKNLFLNDRPGPGVARSSVAFMLERQKSASYPFGFSVEVSFNGPPGGASIIIVQGAETDQDQNYATLGAIATNSLNSANVGRFEGVNLYPRFVRLTLSTINDVLVTAVLTR